MSPPEAPPLPPPAEDDERPAVEGSPSPPPPGSHYAVELYFDPALENQVLRHWNALARRGLSSHLLSIRSRPNVPLLSLPSSPLVEPLRLAPALRSLAARLDPIPISFSSLSTFSVSDSLIFLSPTPTAALLGLHAQLCELAKKEGVEAPEGFRPDGWVPRCAVASDVPQGRMAEAHGVVREFRLPLVGYAVDIALVEVPPVKELFSFPLGGSGTTEN